jgi:hypothetical protein
MICRIDDQPVSRQAVRYRELNFGQAVDQPLHGYEIAYDVQEFMDLLRKDYEEAMREIEADDEAVPDAEPKYFRELGYPSLEELLKHPEYLDDALGWLFWNDLLSATFPVEAGNVASWIARQWVINSIDHVEVKNDTVIVSGKIFEVQTACV